LPSPIKKTANQSSLDKMFFNTGNFCLIGRQNFSTMAEANSIKPINIKEVIKSKSPGVAKVLPGFVFRYIHRIMHIDEINEFLRKYGHYEGIEFVNAIITEFNVKEHVYGFENIPDTGRFIFACNHPLGGFDGMMLMKHVHKKLGAFKFLSNDVLMNLPSMQSLFVPVPKHGSYGRDAANALHQSYSSNEQILIFPSGFASRKIKGEIMDLQWRKHFISKSIEYKRDVIPVFIDGRNSNRFYMIASFRKFFRIKWNLEMFFLPDEMFRHRNTNVTLYFGKPIPYSTFDKTKTYQGWADYVKKLAYELPKSIGIEK